MNDQTPVILLAAPEIGKYGGIATYIGNLATTLQERGWHVHCIATNGHGEGFDELAARVTCHDLSAMPLSLRKPFAAAHLVNDIAPDILLMNHTSLMYYALPLLAERTKPVAVLHSDDPTFYQVAARFRNRIFRWVAPAPKLAQELFGHLANTQRGRVGVLPHGVDRRVFHPANDRSESQGVRIAFVGFIAENKGAHLLPAIMSRVWQECPGAKLTIVGYGPLQPVLQAAFRQMGASDQVVFAGKIEPEGVAEVMRSADVFLLPTRVEGFGLVIAEAMMCGAVPVVSRLCGITDFIVDHDQTGILCEPEDVAAFATGVVSLLKEPSRCRAVSQKSAAQALQRFSVERMVDDYERLFAEPDDRGICRRSGLFGWTWATARQVVGERLEALLAKRAAKGRSERASPGEIHG